MDESEIDEIGHDCAAQYADDVRIRYVQINVEEWSWVLDSDWRARQAEVDRGLAGDVGEVIVSDRLLIGYCPFCGSRLDAIGVAT